MAEKILASVVEARRLTKRFGDISAVDGLSFAVASGVCFGILGPNGAGKTTTIRTIYGYTPRTGGELEVFGLDVARHRRTVAARIGVVQQDNNLDPDLTVAENLHVFARYFDLPPAHARRRTEELLAFTALGHRRDARIDELSGGMQRRLVIARALLHEPDLVVLDEPTTGLDPQARHQVWERLEELRQGGLTTLLTTHYMDEAARLCDRLIIVDHGRLLVEGRPADLVRDHVGRHVVEVPEPGPGVRRFVAERDLDVDDLGHRLLVYTSDGEDLFRALGAVCECTDCHLRMATLEDVFLRLTGRELRE